MAPGCRWVVGRPLLLCARLKRALGRSGDRGNMSSDADVRADVEKMCAALLQLLPLQDEREALSIQGITYMGDCVLRFSVRGCFAAPHCDRCLQPHHKRATGEG